MAAGYTVIKMNKTTRTRIERKYKGPSLEDANVKAREDYSNPVDVQGLDRMRTAGGFENDPSDGTYTVINWRKLYDVTDQRSFGFPGDWSDYKS